MIQNAAGIVLGTITVSGSSFLDVEAKDTTDSIVYEPKQEKPSELAPNWVGVDGSRFYQYERAEPLRAFREFAFAAHPPTELWNMSYYLVIGFSEELLHNIGTGGLYDMLHMYAIDFEAKYYDALAAAVAGRR